MRIAVVPRSRSVLKIELEAVAATGDYHVNHPSVKNNFY